MRNPFCPPLLAMLRWCLLSLVLATSACTGSHERQSSGPEPALAPSSVELTARLLSCDPYPGGQACEVEVAEVHGYGAGTRPLARTDRIVVRFPDALREGGQEPTPQLMPDTQIRFTARAATPVGSTLPFWIATQLY